MLLTVGRILRPHGVRGEVLVEVSTDEPAARYAVGSTLVTDRAEPSALTVDAQRPHQGRLIVGFKGVPDRDAAEALRGVLLRVDSEAVAPPENPDEFHDHQLVGLAVVGPGGEPVGELVRIDHAPAADLLVVERPGAGTALVPFRKEFVPEVDLPGRRIVIDPPPGLLDL
jgi:16S rRNA processing protein RimM